MIGPIRGFIWESADQPRAERRLRRPAISVLLVVVVMVLGLNWPIMATGVRSISPVWMGVFRVAGAAAVVGAIAVATGNFRVPPRRDLPMIASLAVFRLAAVFILVFSALELVPAGRSSVVVWTTSLWTVPIAAVFLGERVIGIRWVGLISGMAGVVVLFEPWGLAWDEPGVTLGHLLLTLAAITNAATAVHIRAHRWTITPLEALPWQLAGAAVLLLAVGLALEGLPSIDWTPQLVAIVAYQGVLASGVALWAQVVVLRNLAAVSATLTLTAVPVVGVVSSTLLLDEKVTLPLAVGLVLVMIGVTLNLASDRWTNQPLRSPSVA